MYVNPAFVELNLNLASPTMEFKKKKSSQFRCYIRENFSKKDLIKPLKTMKGANENANFILSLNAVILP